MRLIVEAVNTREILTRDLEGAKEVQFAGTLSGPCLLDFKLPWRGPNNPYIKFKPYSQIIHVEETVNGVRKILGSAIVQPSEVDEKTGEINVVAKGFADYPNKMPWLQNWNPVIVDPFEIFHKIWNHLQSYQNGDLDVTVYPDSSGTFMLPGFSFDGSKFSLDFFAYFLRQADTRDCGEAMDALARDIPFDYLEQSEWNTGRTQINKKIQLSYPRRGVKRMGLVFRFGENVVSGKPRPSADIEWASDVLVKGWFPGKVYSSDFSNDDSSRLRRVLMTQDVSINSRERAAVWAKRKLTRRQVPDYWEEITVEAYHPNAPFGQWELGDEIRVQGYMPWVGKVDAYHRIIGYTWDGTGMMTLRLKHEGAFNYDPIVYEG